MLPRLSAIRPKDWVRLLVGLLLVALVFFLLLRFFGHPLLSILATIAFTVWLGFRSPYEYLRHNLFRSKYRKSVDWSKYYDG